MVIIFAEMEFFSQLPIRFCVVIYIDLKYFEKQSELIKKFILDF